MYLCLGGLHAISGPDHLAALLPASVGKPGWYVLYVHTHIQIFMYSYIRIDKYINMCFYVYVY
jgi:hypothetical protein